MRQVMAVMLFGLSPFLGGCVTPASRINDVSLGMTKAEVIRAMGRPTSTSAQNGVEFMNYALWDSRWDVNSTPYSVQLVNGHVVSYGRQGDFGTTQQTKQVIEVINSPKQ
jgi:hypothetical protein